MNRHFASLAERYELNTDNFPSRELLEEYSKDIVRDCVSVIAMLGLSNNDNVDVTWTVDTAIYLILRRYDMGDENNAVGE